MGLDEKLHRKGLEWENSRIECDAQCYDIPVGFSKLQKVSKRYFVCFPGFANLVFPVAGTFEDLVNNRSGNAHNAKNDRNQQGTLPMIVIFRGPRG